MIRLAERTDWLECERTSNGKWMGAWTQPLGSSAIASSNVSFWNGGSDDGRLG